MLNGAGRPCLVARAARVALIATTALTGAAMPRAIADTLEGSLALAYQNNPQMNSARAATRAVDESVGVALSGYRPQVSATAQIGEQYLDTLARGTFGGNTPLQRWRDSRRPPSGQVVEPAVLSGSAEGRLTHVAS